MDKVDKQIEEMDKAAAKIMASKEERKKFLDKVLVYKNVLHVGSMKDLES